MRAGSALQIVGCNNENKLIHTQAMRTIDLQGQGLDRYMQDNFQQLPPMGVDLDLTLSRFRAGPGARGIVGDVCYHGEVWLRLDRYQHWAAGSRLFWVGLHF